SLSKAITSAGVGEGVGVGGGGVGMAVGDGGSVAVGAGAPPAQPAARASIRAIVKRAVARTNIG
ncbi:MAG: hypothetical protein ACYC1C_14035, partial [Chloroflexota bacterium]